MRAKFQTESGIPFIYDNNTNGLYEGDGVTPIRVAGGPFNHEAYFAHAATNYNTRKKHNRPAAVRILLGHACNYSCSYCMQKDIGNPGERPRRAGLDNLMKTVAETLDLSDLVRVELWGGEPFLYWPDIMELMRFFDREGLTFFFSTNGSALRAKHAEFFATMKATVIVSISHDAKEQRTLRGEEIFDKPAVIQTLKAFDALENVSYVFTASVMDANFDLFEINDFFREQVVRHQLQNAMLGFSLGRTYQEKMSETYLPCITHPDGDARTDAARAEGKFVIQGENLAKFRVILREFLEQHYQQFIAGGFVDGLPAGALRSPLELPLLMCGIYEALDGYSVMEYARKTITGEPIAESTNCGADMADVLSFDLDGRVRTCPHAGEHHIAGTLHNLKGIRIVGLDLKRKEGGCTQCLNRKLCRSGCPIKFPDEVFYLNCKVEKVWYGEIQMAAFRFIFGEQVELLEILPD